MRRISLVLLTLILLGVPACGGEDTDVPSGLRIVLSHGNNSRPYMPWPAEVAKQIAGDLEEVGFEVEIDVQQWSAYLKNVKYGRHQMAILGWSADVPDTDNFLRALLHKDSAVEGSANNISFYRSDEVSTRIDQAGATHDEAERNRLYREAQRIIHDDVPMVPLVYTDRMIAHRSTHGPLTVEFITHPVLRLMQTPLDGELVFLRGADSTRLDPGDVTDGESSKVIEQIYETLVRYKSGTIEIEPGLAVSWEVSPDHKIWTFQLREGVKFHDGSPLNAEAVVNTFERMRDPKHPHRFADGTWSNWTSLFSFIAEVRAGTHEREVVFECTQAAPAYFLKQLAMFTCSIISTQALNERKEKIRRNPVGTGPYKFVSWKLDDVIELVRNDDYWGGAPKVKRVFFRVSNNATVRSNRLIAHNSCDLIDNLDPSTIAALESDPQIQVARRPKSSLGYLAMNTLKAPFDNPKVRRAVAYAINKAGLIKRAYKGYAQPAAVPVPPGFNGFNGDLSDRPYDPEKAKALLREAGYDVK